MNEVRVFENTEFGKVRTVVINGEVYFVGKDVAEILGYAKPQNAIATHCKGALKQGIGVQTGFKADGTPAIQYVEMSVIPDRDVYRLIMRSKLPAAERFEDWVVSEVLPSISRTGSYSKLLSPAEMLLKQAEAMVEHERKLLAVQEKQIEQDKRLDIIDKRLDMFNGVDGSTSREELRHKVNAFSFKNGLAPAKAWRLFKQTFNDVYDTNVSLLITNYKKANELKKKPTFPEYLELSDRLVDAHMVIDKLLN